MYFQGLLSSIIITVLFYHATAVASDWPARSITASELTRGMNDWEQDYAVFLYAPWCNYCRQFKPIWHEV
jgi:thiol-disulfide isomerase/thioredoxin